jgi:hypothetical protein
MWDEDMNQFMSLMLPNFDNRTAEISKPFEKLSSIYWR